MPSRAASRRQRQFVGVFLIVGWLPALALSLLLTATVFLAILGVPLLMFAVGSFAVGIRLVRGRYPILVQHWWLTLISAFVFAVVFALTLVWAAPSRPTGLTLKVLIGVWASAMTWAAFYLRKLWRSDAAAIARRS